MVRPLLFCFLLSFDVSNFIRLSLPPTWILCCAPPLPVSACQLDNVRLQVEAAWLPLQTRRSLINMGSSLSGRTPSTCPTASQQTLDQQMTCSRRLSRQHDTQLVTILLFIADICYAAWAANHNRCTGRCDTLLWLVAVFKVWTVHRANDS